MLVEDRLALLVFEGDVAADVDWALIASFLESDGWGRFFELLLFAWPDLRQEAGGNPKLQLFFLFVQILIFEHYFVFWNNFWKFLVCLILVLNIVFFY